MADKYHIAASGKNTGTLVPCTALNCRININVLDAAADINSTPLMLSNMVDTFLEDPTVLARIAYNPNTDPETVTFLSNFPDPRVRAAVARRHDLTETQLLGLLMDENKTVRMRAYYNEKTTQDMGVAAILAGGIN